MSLTRTLARATKTMSVLNDYPVSLTVTPDSVTIHVVEGTDHERLCALVDIAWHIDPMATALTRHATTYRNDSDAGNVSYDGTLNGIHVSVWCPITDARMLQD